MPSPPDPDGVPVVKLNDWDNNVWASSSSSSLNRTFTTSVGHTPPNPARSSHSLHRRRTSENVATPSRSKIPWTVQHSRVEPSDSVRGHPLKRDSGGLSSSVLNDPTVTRPILNLRLSPGPTVDVDKNPFEEEQVVQTGPGEREELVLVHEVVATDSLPGVSLKYGISPADLRKANQMWPTDSIHLRKFLNVPVNKASKVKQPEADAPMEAQGTGPGSSTTSLEAAPDIRRIPASHLSFFPQGSPSDVSSIDPMVTGGRRPRTLGRTTVDGGGLPPLPPNPNTSSIFSTLPRAFPIAKDAIMSRLSLDSGGTPPKEEQEHEMGVVGRNRGINGEPLDPARAGTNPESLRQERRTGSRNYDAYRIREEECERASMAIRTSQLEPSPEMLVPVLGQKRTKGEREAGF